MNKGAELNTLGHWQPVELLKKRRGMSAFGFFENQPGTPILDSLKTGNVLMGNAIYRGTTFHVDGNIPLGKKKMTKLKLLTIAGRPNFRLLQLTLSRPVSLLVLISYFFVNKLRCHRR